MPHRFDLLRMTAVDRYQNGIDRPLPDYAHRLRNGVPMEHRETAAAGSIYPRSFNREKDGRYGRGHLGRAKYHIVLPVGRAGGYLLDVKQD